MKSATVVDELTLQSVVLPMGDSHMASITPELPILTPHADAKTTLSIDDTASEATTVRADDDDDAQKGEPSAAAMALGFVERLVREYSLKREIHALISKKQQQLRHMQTLIAAYQEQLLKTITVLDDETKQQRDSADAIEKEARKRLADVVATGADRELVEATRMLGILQTQRCRIVRERTKLRRTVVTMRQEECEWLLKSIVAQHEQECEALLSAVTTKKYLEEGSLQATIAVQITQDDPIFAPVETLFETQPLARQLQLQLDSIDAVITATNQKCEDLEMKEVTPSGPVPLVKRTSFRDRRQESGFPTTDRKRIVRLRLIEGKHIRSDLTTPDLAERHRRYTTLLKELGRMLSDVRTRSGRLLYQFAEKLHDDTMSPVRVTGKRHRDADSNHTEDIPPPNADSKFMKAFLPERYIMPSVPSLLLNELAQDRDNQTEILVENQAVDSLKLPPPAMITAFAKFLTRVITTEYELLAASPSSMDETSDESDETVEQSFEDAMDQTVIQDCVHEMVFQRITKITYASAIDEYRFSRDDEMPTQFLFPLHWHHSKAYVQGIAPSELAFPEDTLTSVSAYLDRHDDEVRRHGFLPKTLALFRSAEVEVTPRGVVRAVMAGFKMLHREIIKVLSDEKASPTLRNGSARRRPKRRGSSFLNADILIPTVVLMMSRLPHAQYLDRLWQCTLLVEAFRSSALSDGGEEAYYLTCLAAAIEFINTFQSTASSTPEVSEDCPSCEQLRRDLVDRRVQLESLETASVSVSAPSPSPTAPGRPRLARTLHTVGVWSKKEHESINQLSKWISDQPPSDNVTTTDIEKVVASHELWTSAES